MQISLTTLRYYATQAETLSRAFINEFDLPGELALMKPLPLTWTQRLRPRRFGKVLDGDVDASKQVCDVLARVLDV